MSKVYRLILWAYGLCLKHSKVVGCILVLQLIDLNSALNKVDCDLLVAVLQWWKNHIKTIDMKHG